MNEIGKFDGFLTPFTGASKEMVGLKYVKVGKADIPGWVTGLATGLVGAAFAFDVCPADLVWQCQEEMRSDSLVSTAKSENRKTAGIKQDWMSVKSSTLRGGKWYILNFPKLVFFSSRPTYFFLM